MTMMWLAADYIFPSTYSCRVPMSSMSSARAMPAPGPATVRLALLRTGIEYVGWDVMRDELFPTICSMTVLIRPPERVAFSQHRVQAYKWTGKKTRNYSPLQESVVVREMAHARNAMTLFLEIPTHQATWYHIMLRSVGYWGRTDSLTTCTRIASEAPRQGEYALPFTLLGDDRRLQPYFCCITSEFRTPHPSWEEVVDFSGSARSPVKLEGYVWPLVSTRHSADGSLFHRRPFAVYA